MEKFAVSNAWEKNEVLFDRSSINQAAFERCMIACAGELQKAGKKIIVHWAVMNELEKMTQCEDGKTAAYKLNLIEVLKAANVIQFVGNSKEMRPSTQQYIEYLAKYRNQKKMVFVTQDVNMALDVIALNHMKSYTGYTVGVYQLQEDGSLEYFKLDSCTGKLSAMETNKMYNPQTRKEYLLKMFEAK